MISPQDGQIEGGTLSLAEVILKQGCILIANIIVAHILIKRSSSEYAVMQNVPLGSLLLKCFGDKRD